MKGLLTLTVFTVLTVAALACGGVPGAVEVTDKDNGRQIELAKDQLLVITLDSNRTTGFQWDLAGDLDEQVLKLDTQEYRGPAISIPGAGGQEVWKFKAVGTGRVVIKLEYRRPWKKERAPARTWTVQVRVK